MKRKHIGLCAALCGGLLLWAGLPADAQIQSATVMGQVIAPAGRPAVGAQVTIKSLTTSRKCEVKTDKNGEYICAGLRTGMYEISVEYGKLKMKYDEVQVAGGLYGNPSSASFKNRFDFDLGRLAEQQQEVSEEQKELEKVKAGFERARALNKAGKFEEAVAELAPVIEHDPTQWIAHAELAVAYEGLGRTEDAIDAYLTAIELNPTDPSLYNNLGQLYLKQGQVEEAREQFEMAAELSGESGHIFYYNMAVTFYNSGDLKSAIEPLKKVVELKPDHAKAHFFLGICLYSTAESKVERGEVKTVLPPGTREHFERYLELEPNGPHAENAKQYLEIIDQSVSSAVRVEKK